VSSILRALAIAAFAFVCASVSAVEDADTITRQIQTVRSITEIERQSTLVRGAQLGDREMAAFVPVYQSYRHEVIELNTKVLQLLKRFSDEFETLTDSQAQSLLRDWLSLERDRVDLKIRYVKKFDKVLPAVKVARVMQIENRMDLLQEVGAASTIPLARP
jgi:hypothetical protein